ncbi:MAG: HDIG domain-containing protein [Acidimicrobiia bacterium]|nr:HDIG domain-containing protein [Acidimicrobiia bacterium]
MSRPSSRNRRDSLLMTPRFRTFITGLILALTVALSWTAMLMGQQLAAVSVTVGEPSPETFQADSALEIEDVEATERARKAARDAVDPVYGRQEEIDDIVISDIQAFFRSVREATVDPTANPFSAVTTSSTIPATTTTSSSTTLVTAPQTTVETDPETASVVSPTTTTVVTPPAPVSANAGVSGRIFIDQDANGLYSSGTDRGLDGIRVVAYDADGTRYETVSFSDGRYSLGRMAPGPATVLIDTDTVHERLTGPEHLLLQEVDLVNFQEIAAIPIPLRPAVTPRDIQLAALRARGLLLSDRAISTLVEIATIDVRHQILDEELWMRAIERETLLLATEALNTNGGILSEELRDVQIQYRSTPRFVQLPDADPEIWQQVSQAVPEVATEFLAANKAVDAVATESLREEEAAQVEPVTIRYEAGQIIVEEGQIVTAQIEAILSEAGLLRPAAPQYLAMAAAIAFVVGLLSLYLFRFQPEVWNSLRRMALFGLLTAMSAVAARAVAIFAIDDRAIGFLMPAAAFGLMTAILFDARTSVLMAVAVGSMTAIATNDPGFVLFAALTTLAPIPFVSAISARRDLRRAALYIMSMCGALAALIVWSIPSDTGVLRAIAFAVGGGAISWLVGSSLLSVFEITFDITTSLRLLDLTDRNHPALRHLEEKAIGSFNHSLMVGTLADRAARAVGANPLLARAGAYYHDLGKTEHPQFFIENQFGIQNPHDQMPPERSAEVIRRHVKDGLVLARKYRIPGDVAEAVVSHHGDGIMHFFYNKAINTYGQDGVDREDYRHSGHKPVEKEMAIIMIADSVEGACRAVFQTEEPTPERIEQLVNRVTGEKVDDGQLSASKLTLGDLTRLKAAMVEALVGHYHQRIPYPNFPEGNSG